MASNRKRHRESFLQGLIPTPHIIPKPGPKPFSHFPPQSSQIWRTPPSPPNLFPHPNPIGPIYRIGTPSAPQVVKFNFHHRSPQSFPLHDNILEFQLHPPENLENCVLICFNKCCNNCVVFIYFN